MVYTGMPGNADIDPKNLTKVQRVNRHLREFPIPKSLPRGAIKRVNRPESFLTRSYEYLEKIGIKGFSTKTYFRDFFLDFRSGSDFGKGRSQLSSAFLGTFLELSSNLIMIFENFRKRRYCHIPGLSCNSKYQESCGDFKF